MNQLEIVQGIYAAFGSGDIPAILETLADDVDWEYGSNPDAVPWLLPRHGRQETAGFFQAIATLLDIQHFAVTQLIPAPDLVVALIDFDFTVKATGKAVSERDEVHLWHFDRNNRVVKFRHRADTHAHVRAYRG